MARFPAPKVVSLSSLEALGPLNSVEAKHAPERLYVAGDKTLLRLRSGVAIVGSRKASDDGLRRARRLARFLVNHGVPVVSGLAAGIDTAAHEAAIEHGGRTIAVLGSALDQVYPRENSALQQRIIRDHCAVSQFPLGTRIARHHFVQRNRTMALVSTASVIIEAGDSSGALSQGWEALRLGRPLFIARSVAENRELSWPEEMCRYGAVVLAEPERILEVIPLSDEGVLAAAAF